LAAEIGRIQKDYETQIQLAGSGQAYGIALSAAAETWLRTARTMAEAQAHDLTVVFLDRCWKEYQTGLARNPEPLNREILALDCLYKALDALANLQAQVQKNESAAEAVKDTEKRVLAAVSQSGPQGPVQPALAGGVLSMLAVIARQIDASNPMAELIQDEMVQRREVADNITEAKDLAAGERLTLMTNNFLQGSVTLVQIIGLTVDPGLKADLTRIQKSQGPTPDMDPVEQIRAAARVLAESGFLAAPALARRPGP
jgi:hypothetical protein